MGAYLILLIVVFILLIVFAVDLYKISYKTIKKFIEKKKWAILLSFLPFILFGIGIYIDAVNAIVVDVYLVGIVYITKFIFWIIKKFTKKEFSEYKILGTGVLLTAIVMIFGYYSAYHVLETNYEISTSKNIGENNFRIVQVSDSHIGTTMDGKKFGEYMKKINELNPDILVITGDFVDDNTSYEDMIEAANGLSNVKTKQGIYFVFGNHDKGYYNNRNYTEIDIRNALTNNDVKILEDNCADITSNIALIGRQDAGVENRASAQDLTKNLDKNRYLIMLDHQPNDYENEKASEVDLVLSGHTHGGQLIPLGPLSILLGANDKTYGMEKRDNTTFIVNSGISDWAMKFKTGAISEYVVIDIKSRNVNVFRLFILGKVIII